MDIVQFYLQAMIFQLNNQYTQYIYLLFQNPKRKYFRRGELTAKELKTYKDKYHPSEDKAQTSKELQEGMKVYY